MTNSRDGDDHHRHDPEHAVADEREHRPEHEHLVGERVEERARPRRAVAAGDVAVDAVAGAQHEPQHERDPRAAGRRSGITQNISGDSSRRPTVMALAHVASALGSTISASGLAGDRRRRRRRRGRARARRRSSTAANSPTPRSWPHVDDAVDLRRLAVAAADARRVDEHLDASRRSAASRRGAVIASCSSVSSPSRSAIEPGGHLAVEVGGVRAVLAAVGEEPAPVELGLLDEAQQLVVVGLGLARVADDEVAAERGVGLAARGCRRCGAGSGRRRPTGASAAAAAC